MRTKLAPTVAASKISGFELGTRTSGVKLLPGDDTSWRPCDLEVALYTSCFGKFNEKLALRSRRRDELIETMCQQPPRITRTTYTTDEPQSTAIYRLQTRYKTVTATRMQQFVHTRTDYYYCYFLISQSASETLECRITVRQGFRFHQNTTVPLIWRQLMSVSSGRDESWRSHRPAIGSVDRLPSQDDLWSPYERRRVAETAMKDRSFGRQLAQTFNGHLRKHCERMNGQQRSSRPADRRDSLSENAWRSNTQPFYVNNRSKLANTARTLSENRFVIAQLVSVTDGIDFVSIFCLLAAH